MGTVQLTRSFRDWVHGHRALVGTVQLTRGLRDWILVSRILMYTGAYPGTVQLIRGLRNWVHVPRGVMGTVQLTRGLRNRVLVSRGLVGTVQLTRGLRNRVHVPRGVNGTVQLTRGLRDRVQVPRGIMGTVQLTICMIDLVGVSGRRQRVVGMWVWVQMTRYLLGRAELTRVCLGRRQKGSFREGELGRTLGLRSWKELTSRGMREVGLICERSQMVRKVDTRWHYWGVLRLLLLRSTRSF